MAMPMMPYSRRNTFSQRKTFFFMIGLQANKIATSCKLLATSSLLISCSQLVARSLQLVACSLRLLFKYVPDEIMVFGEGGQVVVPAAVYTYKRDPGRVELLEAYTLLDGYQPVAGTMQYIGMTPDTGQPKVGTQMVAKDISYGQDRDKSFHHFSEVVVRAVQDQVAGIIVRGNLGGKTTADAASVDQ